MCPNVLSCYTCHVTHVIHAMCHACHVCQIIVYILDVTFKNFKMNGNGQRDYMFSTSPGNEDGQHPIETSGLILVDVEEGSKVFYHRPNVGLVLSYC